MFSTRWWQGRAPATEDQPKLSTSYLGISKGHKFPPHHLPRPNKDSMSKKFRSQASSARAATTLTGSFGTGALFQTSASPLSYVTEQPDLSQIDEPNVVVAFKNLGKKDSTTKAKALEELQESCQGEVGQGLLQAWVRVIVILVDKY